MSNFEQFRLQASCPKCGCENLMSTYDVQLDSLKRTCTHCSYSFHQLPLDRKDHPKRGNDA
jgi:hypothetical protein